MTRVERYLRELARRYGWQLERTRGGHWRLRSPAGATVVASATPSDPRNLRIVESCLRRAERGQGEARS